MGKALSQGQITWINNKITEFECKWTIESPPKCYDDWKALMNEAHELYHKSRDNELMKDKIITAINYIDRTVTDRNRPVLEMIGEL